MPSSAILRSGMRRECPVVPWACALALLLLVAVGRSARIQGPPSPAPAGDGAGAAENAAPLETQEDDDTPGSPRPEDAMLAAAASSGRMPRVWPGPPPQVMSASGRHLAVVTDVGLDDPLQVLRHEKGPIVDVKFFPKGDLVITASYTGTAVIWNATTGQTLHVLVDKESTGQLYQVQVFPEGDRVVTIGENATSAIWDAATGVMLKRLGRPRVDEPHREARVFPKADRVVTAVSNGDDHVATIWSAETGEALHRLKQPTGRIRFLEVSPGGERVATAGGHSAWLWDSESGEKVRGPLGGHEDWITGVAWSMGGAKLITVSADGRCIVWDVHSAARQQTRMRSKLLGVVAAPMLDTFLTFSSRYVFVRNVTTSRLIGTLDHVGEVQRLTISSDGLLAAACHSVPWGNTGKTVVWNTTTGRLLTFLRDIDSENVSMASQPVPCSVAVGAARPALVDN